VELVATAFLALVPPAIRADDTVWREGQVAGLVERLPSLPVEDRWIVERRSGPTAVRAGVHDGSI
jgi:hypothetical protein